IFAHVSLRFFAAPIPIPVLIPFQQVIENVDLNALGVVAGRVGEIAQDDLSDLVDVLGRADHPERLAGEDAFQHAALHRYRWRRQRCERTGAAGLVAPGPARSPPPLPARPPLRPPPRPPLPPLPPRGRRRPPRGDSSGREDAVAPSRDSSRPLRPPRGLLARPPPR